MRVSDRFLSRSTLEIRVDHLSHNRPGTDDGDLHDQIVKTARFQAGQGGHLSPALDLEYPDRVGFLQQIIDLGIIGREVSEIQLRAGVVDQLQRILQDGHHP